MSIDSAMASVPKQIKLLTHVFVIYAGWAVQQQFWRRGLGAQQDWRPSAL